MKNILPIFKKKANKTLEEMKKLKPAKDLKTFFADLKKQKAS